MSLKFQFSDEYLNWAVLPEPANLTVDTTAMNDVFNQTCQSLGEMTSEFPVILQGNLSQPYRYLTAFVVLRGGDIEFAQQDCTHALYVHTLMSHTGVASGRACQPFCGVIQRCHVASSITEDAWRVSELQCQCYSDQCSELLLKPTPVATDSTEICSLFVEVIEWYT